MIVNHNNPSHQLELQECQHQLNLRDEYQKILQRILAKIRASVNLENLCATSCQDICRLLKIERVSTVR